MAGCTWLSEVDIELTPQQKLKLYGCNYVPEGNGFCCKNQVPEEDWDIFNCIYTEWYEKQQCP